MLLLFAIALIGSSVFLARLSFQQELQVLKDFSLGAISIFSSLLAVLTTARLIPQDLEDRTVYTVLSKPVARIEYLLGKLIGVLLLLLVSVAVMATMLVLVLWLRERAVVAETAVQLANAPRTELNEALRAIYTAGFSPVLLAAVGIIYLKAALLASLTLFISTFATSNIFTIVTTFCVYFIGHLQGIAREYWLQEHAAGWATRAFLGAVAVLFPDLQLFNIVDEVIAGATMPLAMVGKTSVLGLFYVVIYLLLAWIVFYDKEL